jgi:hypothetical protein
MVGTALYSTDPETREKLRELVGTDVHLFSAPSASSAICCPLRSAEPGSSTPAKPGSDAGTVTSRVRVSEAAGSGAGQSSYTPSSAREQRSTDDAIIAPQKESWATDEGGQDQVGCIYTCQGLEYDYAVSSLARTSSAATVDGSAAPNTPKTRRCKEKSLRSSTRLATNIDYVLASRGTRGCRVYSTDEQTQEYLVSLLDPAR